MRRITRTAIGIALVFLCGAAPAAGAINSIGGNESDEDIRAEAFHLRVEIQQAREYAKTRTGLINNIAFMEANLRQYDTCIAEGERGGFVYVDPFEAGCGSISRQRFISLMVHQMWPGASAKPMTGEEMVRLIRSAVRASRESLRRLREARESMRTALAKRRQELAVLRPPPPSVPAQTQQQVFAAPMMNGAPVDRCANFAAGCGQEGADQFCKTQGFARATKWDWHYVSRTYVIGWRNYCESAGGHCGALNDVTCTR